MTLAWDEFWANKKVQRGKDHVNDARDLTQDPPALRAAPAPYIRKLMEHVQYSIKNRRHQLSLGPDPGHVHRIGVELGIDTVLRQELERRKRVEAQQRDQDNFARMPALPSTSTWGRPKGPPG